MNQRAYRRDAKKLTWFVGQVLSCVVCGGGGAEDDDERWMDGLGKSRSTSQWEWEWVVGVDKKDADEL